LISSHPTAHLPLGSQFCLVINQIKLGKITTAKGVAMTRRYLKPKQVLCKAQDLIQRAKSHEISALRSAALALQALRIAKEWGFSLFDIGTTEQEIKVLTTPGPFIRWYGSNHYLTPHS